MTRSIQRSQGGQRSDYDPNDWKWLDFFLRKRPVKRRRVRGGK